VSRPAAGTLMSWPLSAASSETLAAAVWRKGCFPGFPWVLSIEGEIALDDTIDGHVYVLTSLSKLPAIYEPVEIKEAEAISDPFLSGGRFCFEVVASSRIFAAQISNGLAEEEGCRRVESQAKEKRL
jgi:hypothetical protein